MTPQARPVGLVLLLGTLFYGLFHIAILPPFEGFDETAHYSYIQQLALTGTWPRHGDPLSADVEDYLAVAPGPKPAGARWSYRVFFEASPETIEAGRAAIHQAPAEAAIFRPGRAANWEAQHPPLYYLVLAPAYRLASSWSLGARLLWLRSLSYGMAWAGLCVAAFAARHETNHPATGGALWRLAPALWPLLLPMWFPEMARLGNDSLLVPIAALVGLLMVRIFRSTGDRWLHLALGLCLGLGLLTKATVLPLAVAAWVLVGVRAWTSAVRPRGAGCLDVGLCVGATLLVAGWWYVGQAIDTGSLLGSNDALTAAQGTSLRIRDAVVAMPRLLWTFGLSFVVWTGTWSSAQPPFVSMLPLLIGAAVLGGGAIGAMRTARLKVLDGFAPLTLALFMAALLYQSLYLLVSTGGGAPAWYLHSLVAILWPLLAWGLVGTTRHAIPRFWLVAQILYGPVFIGLASATEVLFDTGCGIKRDPLAYLDFASAHGCLAHPAIIADRLAVLGFPGLGLVFFLAGGGLLVWGAVRTAVTVVGRRSI